MKRLVRSFFQRTDALCWRYNQLGRPAAPPRPAAAAMAKVGWRRHWSAQAPVWPAILIDIVMIRLVRVVVQ